MHQCIQDWLDFLIFSTFCLTDKHSKCLAVNLYNLAPGKGVIIGDTVAIAEPNFSHVSLQIKEQVSSNLEMQHQWFTLKLFFLNFSAHCIWCYTRGKSLDFDYQWQESIFWLSSRHWIVHFCQKWLIICCDTHSNSHFFTQINIENNALKIVIKFTKLLLHLHIVWKLFQMSHL